MQQGWAHAAFLDFGQLFVRNPVTVPLLENSVGIHRHGQELLPEKEVPALGASADDRSRMLIEEGGPKDGVAVHVQAALVAEVVPMAKGFFTQGADPVPFRAELIDPMLAKRDAVGLKQ